jgi:intermediate peptidase
VYLDKEAKVLGYVYLDCQPRHDKFSHAATFTISLPKVDSQGILKETPKVALVCNIGMNKSSKSILLGHHDLETLFHEFGHCLSALLSRTQYQHVAGTRAALDFIETPSTLMENFVWNPLVLQTFAKHYKSREELPKNILNSLCQSRYLFAGIDMQQQICYSAFDLLVYSQPHITVDNTMLLMKQLHNKYMNFPFVEGTHYYTQFGHLVSYGAGYYSYLYCKNFSSNIWNYYFKNNPFNKGGGSNLVTKLFHEGGRQNPNSILHNILGNHLNIANFIAEINSQRITSTQIK